MSAVDDAVIAGRDVRFTPTNRHQRARASGPLSAKHRSDVGSNQP
jgi:hypothetical protein